VNKSEYKKYTDMADDIVQWLYKYCKKHKIQRLVTGVSGGIDSAVVAVLCSRVTKLSELHRGQTRVYGDIDRTIFSFLVAMPYDVFSDHDSYNKSIDLFNAMCGKESNSTWKDVTRGYLQLYTYEICSILEAYQKCKCHVSKGSSLSYMVNDIDVNNDHVASFINKRLRQGNLRARIRANILYDIAAKKSNGLVVGTCNLDEEMIGYVTKGGDSLSDIEPLAQLHKSEVYKLAEVLQIIPKSILEAIPSAGLWEGQSDYAELGMTYDQIEVAIDTINDKQFPWIKGETLDDTFKKIREKVKLVDKVRAMIDKSEHKRRKPFSFTPKE